MTDIKDRLRNFGNSGSILTEAADRIEELEVTNNELIMELHEAVAAERERLLSLFDGKMVVTLRWVRHMIGLPAEEAAAIRKGEE